MWELWTLMWILCYSQIIRIKKYSVTKYCRCAQRNPNKKCPPQKGFAPTSEKWIGSIILPCSQVKCNYTTVQESVLYKKHRGTVNKNLWWKKLQMAIFVCLLGPKLTRPHQSIQRDIVKPILQYFNQSLIGCNLEADQHLKEALSYQHQCKITTYPLRDIYHQHPHHYQCHHVIYLCKSWSYLQAFVESRVKGIVGTWEREK